MAHLTDNYNTSEYSDIEPEVIIIVDKKFLIKKAVQ